MPKTETKEIVITRQFDARREQVWQAWTEPEQIEQWWGPHGFTTRVDEFKFRPGGKFKYTMLDEEGNEYPSVGEFREIAEPERIVATDEFGEEMIEASSGDLPTGMVTTTVFEKMNGNTKITIRIMHQSVEDRRKHENMGVVDGFNEQLDKLSEYLK